MFENLNVLTRLARLTEIRTNSFKEKKTHMLFHGIATDTFVTTKEYQSFTNAKPETVCGLIFRREQGCGFFLPPQKPTSPSSNSTRVEDLHKNQLRLCGFTLLIYMSGFMKTVRKN